MRPKPDKKELAKMKALHDLGASARRIGVELDRSHHTVIKYLNSDLLDDPMIRQMVEKIRDRELNDLTLLGYKARRRLHEMLDNDSMKPIEAVATMDRSFQQRQLLQGRATSIIDYQSISSKLEALEAELVKLESGVIDITPKEIDGC